MADHSRLNPGAPGSIDEPAAIAEAMLRGPHLLEATATAAQLREFFTDAHVHVALVVDGGRLISVVQRDDLGDHPATALARELGALDGRTVGLHDDLGATRGRMESAGIRRLAVVDADQHLHGLLCLKRSGTGFCTDAGIASRRGSSAD